MIDRYEDSPLAVLELEDYLTLAAILLLPWMFGGVEIWASRTAALLLVAGAAVVWVRDGGRHLLPVDSRRWLWPAFLLVVLALLQVTPLPRSVVELVSPRAAAIQADARPAGTAEEWNSRILERVPEASSAPAAKPGEYGGFGLGDTGGDGGGFTVSLHRQATWERLFWFVALLAGLLVVLHRSATPAVYRFYKDALFLLFTAIAGIGLLQQVYWNGKILWIRELLAGGTPLGPYVNPTHFAGVMELGAPWLAGYALLQVRRGGWAAFRNPHAPLAIGATVLCVAAGIVSASKFAAATLAVNLTILAVMTMRSLRRRAIVLGAAIVAWGGAAVALMTSRLAERTVMFVEGGGQDLGAYQRVVAWKAALPMVQDFAWTGVGFGAFRQIFPRYLPPGERSMWLRLHNDYLEILVEGGILAGVLVAWLTWSYFRRLARRPSRSLLGFPDTESLGLVLGVLALMAHAAVDFNHQIPANALLFVSLAGLAVNADRSPAPRIEEPK